MSLFNESPESNQNQNNGFDSFGYKDFLESSDVILSLIGVYNPLLRKHNIDRSLFESMISNQLEQSNINQSNIIGTKLIKENIYLYLDTGEKLSINIFELKEQQQRIILGKQSKQEVEDNVAKLQRAIDTIFVANEGTLWNDEIDNKDVISVVGYGENLTLADLKRLLEIESVKLKEIYKISGETSKYIQLLKTEITFFSGLGDKYEGGARYFSLSQGDIDKKIRFLSQKMSIGELINYAVDVHEQIDGNYKKSKMVEQVNKKLVKSLHNKIFDRLISEDASNGVCIDFAKMLTGRGELIGGLKGYQSKQEFAYRGIEIGGDYKDIDLANKVLIHVMYKEQGVLNDLKKKHGNKLEIQDEKVGTTPPKEIIGNFRSKINTLQSGNDAYVKMVFQKAGYIDLLDTSKSYNELSFDEKVFLGSLVRITEALGEIPSSQNMTTNDFALFIENKMQACLSTAFTELNDAFSDNIDGWGGLFGEDARAMGLTGEFAEIFDLYQDINGNSGLFDLSDKTLDNTMGMSTAVVLGVGLIAGIIILGPVIGTVGAAYATSIAAGASIATASTSAVASVGMMKLFATGAILGTTVGTTSALIGKQGYDSIDHAAIDMGAQIGADAILTGTTNMIGIPILARMGIVNPDLLFGRTAISGAGLVDKGIILSEVALAGMVVAPGVSSYVGNQWFPENNFDTEKFIYKNGGVEEKIDNN